MKSGRWVTGIIAVFGTVGCGQGPEGGTASSEAALFGGASLPAGFAQCDVAILPLGTPLADTGILGLVQLQDSTMRAGMNGGGLWSFTPPGVNVAPISLFGPAFCPTSFAPIVMSDIDPGSAPPASPFGANTSPPNGPVLDLALDLRGRLWATRGYNQVAQIDPNTGATIGSPIPSPNGFALGLAIDPRLGNIYFGSRNFVAGTSVVYRIPATCNPLVPATCPVTQFATTAVTGDLDDIAWSCTGQTLLGASEHQNIVSWPQGGGPVGAQYATTAQNGLDGIVFGLPGSTLQNFVYTNNNDGSVSEICVNRDGAVVNGQVVATGVCPAARAPSTRPAPVAPGTIASGSGLRGDFMTTDNNGSLILSQLDRVTAIFPPTGGGFSGSGGNTCGNLQCSMASNPACVPPGTTDNLSGMCNLLGGPFSPGYIACTAFQGNASTCGPVRQTCCSNLGLRCGPDACVVGTNSLTIRDRVVISDSVASNNLNVRSQARVNGSANVNGPSRIDGGRIFGSVSFTGPAPVVVNGGSIGPLVPNAGVQANLPLITIHAASAPPFTVNPGPTVILTPNSSRGDWTFNSGANVILRPGEYFLTALTIQAAARVTFDTSTGPIIIHVQGNITINGGIFSGNAARVFLYSNSNVTVNSGVGTLPATIVAPQGTVNIGPNNRVGGCVGGRDVNLEPGVSVTGNQSVTI